MPDDRPAGRRSTFPPWGWSSSSVCREAGSRPSPATHFKPTEVISSDFCRGLVADDENDQSATPDAFDVLHYIVGKRLRRGLLTVVDATNVQPRGSRGRWSTLARSHDVLSTPSCSTCPKSVAIERNAAAARPRLRRPRHPPPAPRPAPVAPEAARRRVSGGSTSWAAPSQIDAVEIVRERLWNDRSDLPRPVRHHRRRPRLLRRAARPAHPARAGSCEYDDGRRRRRLPSGGPAGGLRR